MKRNGKMEHDRLSERLGNRERMNSEEIFAPHMQEERVVEKKRVYLVFLDRYDNYSFRDVFFTQEAAELFISKS
jgi:hypothetical protein